MRARFTGVAAAMLITGLITVGPLQAEPITVVDPTGREIELAAPAEKIVAYPVPSASVVIALSGGIDRLAALHPEAKVAIEDGILGEFYPEAMDLPTNILAGGATRGREPDLEALQAFDPDFVIQWDHADEHADSLIEAGHATARLIFGDEDHIHTALRMIGGAVGNPDKVERLIEWREEVAATIREGVADLDEADKPKVAYFFYAMTDLYTEGAGSYMDWQIELVGGTNPAHGIDGWGKVTAEEVADWNPDIILLGTFESGLHIDRILDDPILGQTTAAREKRVYKMPLGGYRWEPASHESPMTWMWLAEILHPDLFDFDLRAEVMEWYPFLYGQTPTDSQIDGILHVDMNGAGMGYAQFEAE